MQISHFEISLYKEGWSLRGFYRIILWSAIQKDITKYGQARSYLLAETELSIDLFYVNWIDVIEKLYQVLFLRNNFLRTFKWILHA